MPEPQLENGYLKIANELVEEFAKIQLSPNEWRVCWAFLRKTYGFNKKEDAISLTQFQQITKLSRPAIVKALKKLVAKQILVANKQLFTNHYSLNKDYSQWVSSYVDTSSRLATITSSYTDTTLVSKQQPKLVSIQIHTIDNKDNIQKTILKTVSQLNKYPDISDIKENDLIEIGEWYKVPLAFVRSEWYFIPFSYFYKVEIGEWYKVPLAFVRSELEDMTIWKESNPKNPKTKGRNWRMTLMGFVKRDMIKRIDKAQGDPTRRNIDARNI